VRAVCKALGLENIPAESASTTLLASCAAGTAIDAVMVTVQSDAASSGGDGDADGGEGDADGGEGDADGGGDGDTDGGGDGCADGGGDGDGAGLV